MKSKRLGNPRSRFRTVYYLLKYSFVDSSSYSIHPKQKKQEPCAEEPEGQGLSEASVKRVVIPFMRVEHTSHSCSPKVLSLIMAILEVVSTWTMEGYNYSNCRNLYAENSNLPWVLGVLYIARM